MESGMSINKFFVYGTLRPDVKAPWSDSVHKNPNFKLKYYKSYLTHSKLFMNTSIGYPMCIYDKEKFGKEEKTIGYLLESDNIKETLIIMDEIEDYPNEYDRIIVECMNNDLGINEKAYFYTANLNIFKMEELNELNINDFIKIK